MAKFSITSRTSKWALFLYTLGLFLAFSLISKAYGETTCLDVVRNKITTSPPQLSSEVLNRLGITKETLAKLPRLEESFTKGTSDGGKTFEILFYEYKIKMASAALHVSYDIAGKDTDAANTEFSLSTEVIVSTPDDFPIAEEEVEYIYLKGCSRLTKELATTVFRSYKNTDKTATADWSYRQRGSPFKMGTKDFALKGLGPNLPFNIAEKYLLSGTSKLPEEILSETELIFPFNKIKYQFFSTENKKYTNLTNMKLETYKGIRCLMWLNDNPTPVAKYSTYSTANNASRTFGVIFNLPYSEESVSKISFMQSLLSPTHDRSPRVAGFTDKDWYARYLTYDLKNSNYKLGSYENYQVYYSFSGSTIFSTSQVNMPIPLSTSVATLSSDQTYLRATKYIQPNLVMAIAQQIPHQDTRLALAMAIVKKVNELITYDEDQVNNGLVDLMTTEEILKTRKGVCQHYANLFTAIARAKGLPARIVAGYALRTGDDFAGAHAWIEFKIDHNTWWPLDPQAPDAKYLPHRGYFPVTVHTSYEALASLALHETEDDAKLMGPYIRSFIEMYGATFIKRP